MFSITNECLINLDAGGEWWLNYGDILLPTHFTLYYFTCLASSLSTSSVATISHLG